jgi:hypothetical protein
MGIESGAITGPTQEERKFESYAEEFGIVTGQKAGLQLKASPYINGLVTANQGRAAPIGISRSNAATKP